jgi:AcrR family transcriptional regulator
MIEDAATELFASQGYVSTSVEDIVRAAGLTKPMLYRHFESKQELCIALLDRHREELVAAPLGVFDQRSEDRHGQLVAMTEAWLEHTRQHPAATRLLLTPILGDPEVERVQQALHARQRATLTALLREFAPAIHGPEDDAMGQVLWSALGAASQWWQEHPDVPLGVPAGVLVRMVEGMIGSAEDPDEHG